MARGSLVESELVDPDLVVLTDVWIVLREKMAQLAGGIALLGLGILVSEPGKGRFTDGDHRSVEPGARIGREDEPHGAGFCFGSHAGGPGLGS